MPCKMPVAAGLLAAMLPFAASADTTFSSKSRASLFSSQLDVLDNRAAGQYANSVRYMPKSALEEEAGNLRYQGRYNGPHLATARAAAERYNVPADLFLRLVQQESGWNASAVSHKGAIGLAQLMPDTAALLGVDAYDPAANLNGGARYLRMMYDKFGTWRLALAAYNAGPGAVEKHAGVPPYQETTTYVARIWGH